MSKPNLRARLAALSFTEKVRILEKLRDRDKAIAGSGLRPKNINSGGAPNSKGKME